mgnify:CR=1 FL=1
MGKNVFWWEVEENFFFSWGKCLKESAFLMKKSILPCPHQSSHHHNERVYQKSYILFSVLFFAHDSVSLETLKYKQIC